MTNSREKGARYEREIAERLRIHGLNARRGQQYSGANGDPDIVCEDLERFHLECKRRAKYIAAADLYEFMEQAERDSQPGAEPKIPAVIHRINGEPSLVTMYLDDWIEVAAAASSLGLGPRWQKNGDGWTCSSCKDDGRSCRYQGENKPSKCAKQIGGKS